MRTIRRIGVCAVASGWNPSQRIVRRTVGCVTVLDQAVKWLGTTETRANVVPGITDRWGINGQPWCMAAARTWAQDAGLDNFGPGDPVSLACDPTSVGVHRAGNVRKLTDGRPGDVIIFGWYRWQYVNGVPTINDGGRYHGAAAGDHVGVIAEPFDGAGYWCIEGNTSSAGSDMASQTNGDGVYRKWRSLSLVCCVIPTADRFTTPFSVHLGRPEAPAPASDPAQTAPQEEFEMPDYFYHVGSANSPEGAWYPVYPGGKMRQDMLWDEVNHLVLNVKVPVFHCATPPAPTRFVS